MTLAILCGAAVGFGVWLFLRGLVPAEAPLATALGALERPPVEIEANTFLDRLGLKLLEVADSLGLRMSRLRRDLAITDRSLSRHLAEKVGLGLLGLVLVPSTAAIMALGGVHMSLTIPLWISLIAATVLFLAPDFGVRSEAAERRKDFRHVLGSFLDLVVIGLAGGAGVESALQDAAEAGDGWGFARLSQTLATARVRKETPWVALGRLGSDLGVNELIELAASVGLAGTEGAKVRQSLAAKATSLRAHQLADTEAEAQSSTEKMSLPVVLLFAGFLVFIGYPAISRVLTGL